MQTYLEQIAATVLVADKLLFAAGISLVLCGLYLRWRLNDMWMEAEERAKDGWLSEEQARRRITFVRISGPLMMVLGVGAFGLLFLR
jgi:hypothetical protein